jgi:hypothetical protein
LVLFDASRRAIPPPDTIPSFTAALVAQIASSTLSVFSFNSISELAPTFTTATLADNLAKRFSSLITSPGAFALAINSFTELVNSCISSVDTSTCSIVSVSLVVLLKHDPKKSGRLNRHQDLR